MTQTMPTAVSKPLAPQAIDVENDPEFKAHVYQQLVELQPFLSPESQVAVVVKVGSETEEDFTDTDDESTSIAPDEDQHEVDEDFALTLVATLGEYRLEAEGRNADLYEALGIAKRKMLQQLDEVYSSAIDSDERGTEIDALMRGELTLH